MQGREVLIVVLKVRAVWPSRTFAHVAGECPIICPISEQMPNDSALDHSRQSDRLTARCQRSADAKSAGMR
jgi:hypothetical protein